MNNALIRKLGFKTGLYICASFILLFLLMVFLNYNLNITLVLVSFLLLFFWIYIAVYSYRLNVGEELKPVHGLAIGFLSSGTGLTLFGVFFLLFSLAIDPEFITHKVGNVGLTTALLIVISLGMLAACLFSFCLMQFNTRMK